MTELRGSATLTASTEINASYLKENVVDGNTLTEWATNGEGINSWITFTWASPVTVCEIRLLARAAGTGWSIPRFTFSDATFEDGYIQPGTDFAYQLTQPKTTTSLKIGMPPTSSVPENNSGFSEVYISDTYTSRDTVNLHHYGVVSVSSQFNASEYRAWNPLSNAYTGDWACNGEGSAAWYKITWPSAVNIDTIILRDRQTFTTNRWGTPRFEFSDGSTQDGSGAVSNTGNTTYSITPVTTTFVKITVLSGSAESYIGFSVLRMTGDVNPPATSEVVSGALLLTELTPASAGKASGALLLSEIDPASFGKISGAMLLVEMTDSPNPFGIIPTTLQTRSTAATLRTKRKTYATLNERETALTLEERP